MLRSNATSVNPFARQRELLTLWQGVSGAKSIGVNLDGLWSTINKEKDKTLRQQLRELFFIILIAGAELPRTHNILREVPSLEPGGYANRQWGTEALNWMKKSLPEQYMHFLIHDVFRQYISTASILTTQVRTKKGTATQLKVINSLDGVDLNRVAEYLASIIRSGSEGEKVLLAKYLVKVNTGSKAKTDKAGNKVGRRKRSDSVRQIMSVRASLYLRLSEIMAWPVEEHAHNYRFRGLYQWRKQYNQNLESVLFSEKKVLNMDETQFKTWLDSVPGSARHRVRKRLLNKDNKVKDKWPAHLAQWFLEWEGYKDKAQQKARDLTEKVRQGMATEEEIKELTRVKSKAKVTGAGAVSLLDTLEQYLKGKGDDRLMYSILERMPKDVPVLVFRDVSSSTESGWRMFKGTTVKQWLDLLQTLYMLNNPATGHDDLFVAFAGQSKVVAGRSLAEQRSNRFLNPTVRQVHRIIDRTAPFSTNFNSIAGLANRQGISDGTSLRAAAQGFHNWIMSLPTEEERQQAREYIQGIPLFLVLSDGDLNSDSSPAASVQAFRADMRNFCGWDGLICFIEVAEHPTASRFQDIEGLIHFTSIGPDTLQQMLMKLNDLDIPDPYQPLKALHEMNRYAPVRANVLT